MTGTRKCGKGRKAEEKEEAENYSDNLRFSPLNIRLHKRATSLSSSARPLIFQFTDQYILFVHTFFVVIAMYTQPHKSTRCVDVEGVGKIFKPRFFLEIFSCFFARRSLKSTEVDLARNLSFLCLAHFASLLF